MVSCSGSPAVTCLTHTWFMHIRITVFVRMFTQNASINTHMCVMHIHIKSSPREVRRVARGGLWWRLASPCVIQQDVPRVPDLLTTAWPMWIHKHAQQAGAHAGTPSSLSYWDNTAGNFGPASVVSSCRDFVHVHSHLRLPPPFFISLSGLLLRPQTQLWVNENTAWPMQRNRNNDTTPSLPCAVFFSSTVSHFGSTRHLHPSIFSSGLQALCSYVR